MKYYQPRIVEENHLMLNFSGNHRAFDGAEALRRSALDFHWFANHRIRPELEYGVQGGPWIVPLMRRENTRLGAAKKGRPAEKETDIQYNGSVLLISIRAHDVFAPLVPVNTEFLPVEVENADNVFWVRPVCHDDVLDTAASYSSGGPQFEKPVLIGSKLTGDNLFCFGKNANPPVFSERLVHAIAEAGLYGVTFREVPVI